MSDIPKLIGVIRSGKKSEILLAIGDELNKEREANKTPAMVASICAQAIVAEREGREPDPNKQLARAIETILHDTPGHEITIRYDAEIKSFLASSPEETHEPCGRQVASSDCLLGAVQGIVKAMPNVTQPNNHMGENDDTAKAADAGSPYGLFPIHNPIDNTVSVSAKPQETEKPIGVNMDSEFRTHNAMVSNLAALIQELAELTTRVQELEAAEELRCEAEAGDDL